MTVDGKILVPEAAKEEVLRAAHLGHLSKKAMAVKIRSICHWDSLEEQVDDYVGQCSECTRVLPSKPEMEPARSTPPSAPFEEASADFLFDDYGTKFLVYVCRLSNFFELVKMNSAAGGNTLQEFRQLFSRWGAPKILRTDSDPVYLANDCQDLFKEFGVRHVASSPYRPQSNGHAESAGVRQAKKTLKHHRYGTPGYQQSLIAWRNKIIKSRGQSPAEMVLGRSLRSGQWPVTDDPDKLPPPAVAAAEKLRNLAEKDCQETSRATGHDFKAGDAVIMQGEQQGRMEDVRKTGRGHERSIVQSRA